MKNKMKDEEIKILKEYLNKLSKKLGYINFAHLKTDKLFFESL